jgi:hypothetical protein
MRHGDEKFGYRDRNKDSRGDRKPKSKGKSNDLDG